MNDDNIALTISVLGQLLIASIPSVFAIAIVYLTNRLNEKTVNRNNVLKTLQNRIDKLYSPFFKIIYISEKYDGSPFNYPKSTLVSICTILIDNITYCSTGTQDLILSFYTRYNSLIFKIEMNDEIYDFEHDEFMTDFMTMYYSIYKEYKDICNKLSLPEPIDCLEEYSNYVLKF
ncbi:hypothetical protein [Longicatena caecimuris]|uniref:hypothetical protein n=1 Tax=Longicatena caecimuris TaxID=1796635 RepID=UPI0018AA5295|nr:hypothetical protein [Longicatena caecimuris]